MLNRLFKKTPSNSYITIDIPKKQEKAQPEVPKGLWRKCNKCGAPIYAADVISNHYICPKCSGYFRIHASRRIEMLADEGSFEEWDRGLSVYNPLSLSGYPKKLAELQEKTGLDEAVITGKISMGGQETVIGVMDGRFIMGSMGHNVGEKITRAVERATEERLPVILFCCSGGARMQEGIVSLMQMEKTSAALKRHSDAGLLYISVLTEPTTGGVTASFAMLGDIILAEPGALVAFAGPRVIEQTIGQKLPEGFQRAEFLLDHGFVDAILKREESREVLIRLLILHKKKEKGFRRSLPKENGGMEIPKTPKSQGDGKSFTAWERVKLSRKQGRLTGLDYIEGIFDNFTELHGDRYFKDDKAIVGGIASFHGCPVTVIAQQKGRNTKENIERNFSMPSPDGYRKALRLMKQAEKFGRPVFCFVDTPGAFCGMEAEERGQGEAIARNLFELSSLSVPILSVVIGEGGSGGALALAVADEVWMLENAVYSVLSPEGFASILWKDSKRADEAAAVMKMTAEDLKRLGIIERIIGEPEPASGQNREELCRTLEQGFEEFLDRYGAMDRDALAEHRYARFRKM
ncbi:acetyl-CoA carboxylase carboxyltransferase subunit alpha [Fusibacillus kribbianus]|uniref:Multifunctional fusion protein n=1 Tax=Fusibacillus kribbianus TaxID=3044208 RepID=A0AAP4BEM1_9FIRM|nr:acetyl-CoA carboxylase carboxyltransferase subunit alpha [Ruminococcus sp. YH-rum2234]MDI9243304.1 acetyl-CoA carboxylase carboxyltransferase subunit alpha [Ruminococcus sp. YH-rum2234]